MNRKLLQKHTLWLAGVLWRASCLSTGPITGVRSIGSHEGGLDDIPMAISPSRQGEPKVVPGRTEQKLSGGKPHMATATKKKKSKSKTQLQPLGDRVVVRREESESTTAGGIVLPDSAKDKPARGEIVSVGTGRLLDDGTRGDFQVEAGDRVIFSSYAGEAIEVNSEELLLMREDDILAVIED
jgi:chaperonin GroES